MKKQTGSMTNRALIAVMTLIITYFSIVSTFTNARVSEVENRAERCSDKVVGTEQNIAVILEKIKHIETMIMMMREELKGQR